VHYDVHHIIAEPQIDKLLFSTPGVVGSGGNSGFQAFNLVAQFGVRRIILIGFDMRLDTGVHFHGPHRQPLHNPHAATVMRWRQGFDAAAPVLKARGIEVFNASPDSTLQAYPYATVDDVLEGKV
jgi:hypothetical protein